MCKEAGAIQIGIVDPDPGRLHWGEKFGAAAAFTFPKTAAPTAPIPGTSNATPPLPWPEADIVFDMTGDPQAMKTGLDSLAIGGCAVWIGAVYPAPPVQVDAQMIVRKLLQIRGLHNYNYQDFVHATSFIENNYRKYPFENLVEKEYSLDDIEAAFTFASNSKPVRVGIKI